MMLRLPRFRKTAFGTLLLSAIVAANPAWAITDRKLTTSPTLSTEARTRVQARVAQATEELTLKALRQDLALTQAQVGANAAMTQSELSRLEGREDHLTSTLRRYIEALGGKLEVTAVFGKRRVKLSDA